MGEGETNTRLNYIDFAKGIGIILVVGAHLINEGGMKFKLSDNIGNYIYQFHMPAFFVISGFTIALSFDRNGNNAYHKIIERSIKLFVGYILWSFIYLYISKVTFGKLDYEEEFTAIFSLRGRAPIWFLAALALAEIGYLAVHYFAQKIHKESVKELFLFSFVGLSIIIVKLLSMVDVSSIVSIKTQYFLITITRFFPSLSFVLVGSMLYQLFKKVYSGGGITRNRIIITARAYSYNNNVA